MRKIMIICQCATNKGDRAIAEYLLDRLSSEDIFITLSTTEPTLWANTGIKRLKVIGMGYRNLFDKINNRYIRKICHRITKLYYEHFVYPELISNKTKKNCERISKEYISALKEAELVIVTGGHHITSIRNKNALFAITYDIALASIYSKKYILWSQTIGPLSFENQKIKGLFAKIINNANAVFIRDDNSRRCLDELVGSNQGNIFKSYDSVFGFGNKEYRPIAERENKVGISIFNGLKKAFDTYPAIAKVLDFFALQGNSIEFFRMEHDAKELRDIKSIIDLMKVKATIKIYPFESSTEEHLQELSSCRYYIGYKTHSVIMALATGTPLLGICYHKKTHDFMADYGLEGYAIDDEMFNEEQGILISQKIIEQANNIHMLMIEKSKEIAFAIRDHFEEAMKQ
ncbi:MAG: polysaccharide pyruvyl transferase family protein [Firmicutes bacterium]|nr:polysaccharide pyruvyl transferase family protein [Bacillota bacterium]